MSTADSQSTTEDPDGRALPAASGMANPYIAGAPVLEARMFFGREDIFAWIESSLAGKYADHILVLHG